MTTTVKKAPAAQVEMAKKAAKAAAARKARQARPAQPPTGPQKITRRVIQRHERGHCRTGDSSGDSDGDDPAAAMAARRVKTANATKAKSAPLPTAVSIDFDGNSPVVESRGLRSRRRQLRVDLAMDAGVTTQISTVACAWRIDSLDRGRGGSLDGCAA